MYLFSSTTNEIFLNVYSERVFFFSHNLTKIKWREMKIVIFIAILKRYLSLYKKESIRCKIVLEGFHVDFIMHTASEKLTYLSTR